LLSVLAATVCASPIGCCDQPAVLAATSKPPIPDRVPEQAPERPPVVVTETSPEPSAQIFSPEALKARVFAQEYILGKSGDLFGDYPNLVFSAEAAKNASAENGKLGIEQASALDALPGSSGETGGGETPVVDGNTLGLFVPLELPEEANSDPLGHFYTSLRTLRDGHDPDNKVRVMVYGASHTAADVYTGYLRAYLQHRFGDGGLGYVALARTNRWYRLHAFLVESSKGWTVEHAQRRKARKDGYYGLLGASTMTTQLRDSSRVTPRAGRFTPTTGQTTYDLMYLAQPKGGALEVKIGGESVGVARTAARAYAAGYLTVTRDGGPEEVEVQPTLVAKQRSKKAKKSKRRTTGEVRLFGMTVENDQPGVVVDTLGIGGTRASNHLKWNEKQWAELVKRRNPDLYILAYGTNEASDSGVPISYYRKTLRQVLDRFKRAAPEASCLLVGPGDYQTKGDEDVYSPVEKTTKIRDAQREIALEKGCAFWDAMAFMGGSNTINVWATSEPAMAKSDHIHLTGRGYLRMGMSLTDALMEPFDARASGEH